MREKFGEQKINDDSEERVCNNKNDIQDVNVKPFGIIMIIFVKQIPDYKSKYKPKLSGSVSIKLRCSKTYVNVARDLINQEEEKFIKMYIRK